MRVDSSTLLGSQQFDGDDTYEGEDGDVHCSPRREGAVDDDCRADSDPPAKS